MNLQSKSSLTFTCDIPHKTVIVFFALHFIFNIKFSFLGRTTCSHAFSVSISKHIHGMCNNNKINFSTKIQTLYAQNCHV